MKKSILLSSIILFSIGQSCQTSQNTNEEVVTEAKESSFDWNTASIYFLLTDRFNNGDTSNDVNFDRTTETGKLRNFMGGDIKGITQKIKEGYFTDLGIDAIWFSPIFEQIHGSVNEGSGVTYAFHGYWPKDWSSLDPNYGTKEDLKEIIEVAHSKGIRVLLDIIINHTGPVTERDPVWPNNWVRTSPQCEYKDYPTTANCTLVKNLPDVLTDSNENVDLPAYLVEKWKQEGRYEQEIEELDKFFEETGFPRAPRYYIMKWLIDFINDFGIDGFRVDTVKHLHEDVFAELAQLAQKAFDNWKRQNQEAILDDSEFFMLGEVYGYGISGKQYYNFGDRRVNYFSHGFNSLINFEFANDAKGSYESIFKKYDSLLKTEELKGKGILNYIASHDDGNPFDPQRKVSIEAANKLLLTPGGAQIYYGDETARSLVVEDAEGDATLRSFMNWEQAESDSIQLITAHWKKLGKFRQAHPSIARGRHKMLRAEPYVFSRALENDQVIIGLGLPKGGKSIDVKGFFENGIEVTDHYSTKKAIVTDGTVTIDSEFETVLLER